ncbi:hypothetical protein QQP08_015603 [Theobroma cacao]|nr:hypothetical protein QQP08_015603 [Theobroma cacao]
MGRGIVGDIITSLILFYGSKSVARVTKLKAESLKRKRPLLFSSEVNEDVEDEFEGVKVTWYKGKHSPEKKIIYKHPPDDKNYYTLIFHPKYRDIIMERYLNYILQEGKAIKKKRRRFT